MRLPLTAALIACTLSVVPQFGRAQDGADAAPTPSPAARQALWCGAAFAILASGEGIEASVAADYKARAGIAFGNAAAELVPGGMTVDQFKSLAQSIAADVTAPFRDETYTREQCDAAATAPASAPEEAGASQGGPAAPIPVEPRPGQ
jgi:hypothetical protein